MFTTASRRSRSCRARGAMTRGIAAARLIALRRCSGGSRPQRRRARRPARASVGPTPYDPARNRTHPWRVPLRANKSSVRRRAEMSAQRSAQTARPRIVARSSESPGTTRRARRRRRPRRPRKKVRRRSHATNRAANPAKRSAARTRLRRVPAPPPRPPARRRSLARRAAATRVTTPAGRNGAPTPARPRNATKGSATRGASAPRADSASRRNRRPSRRADRAKTNARGGKRSPGRCRLRSAPSQRTRRRFHRPGPAAGPPRVRGEQPPRAPATALQR